MTLDLDFSDILRFPPYYSPGIVILRTRGKLSYEDVKVLVRQLLKYLETNIVENQLWVVEKNRIRIHKEEVH